MQEKVLIQLLPFGALKMTRLMTKWRIQQPNNKDKVGKNGEWGMIGTIYAMGVL